MYEYTIKKVVEVVDGDTVDVEIDLGFHITFASRIRLAGIDTPESRTKDATEKKLGLEAKEYLKKKLENANRILVQTEKSDSSEKYGRILGWLWLGTELKSLNDQMVEDGYAWKYDGGTKVKDFDALLKLRK